MYATFIKRQFQLNVGGGSYYLPKISLTRLKHRRFERCNCSC